MSIAIYPGSFDPITNGHLDIIKRGLNVFDKLIIAVSNNPQKEHFFPIEERVELVRQAVKDQTNLEIDTFCSLLVDYASDKNVNVILRGLRAVSDFEYELQLSSMNRRLNHKIDTVIIMTSQDNYYISSKLVREIASLGGDITSMVPKCAQKALKARYSNPIG